MAQTGYTPISLYYSATAAATPSAVNLANGELAINITDGKLYYKDNGGVVQLIASKAGASGDVVGPASATDNAIVRFDGTTGKLVQNSVVTIADSTGDISGVGQLNATTVDTTNVEVTNIKAKDGTAAATIADSTGVVSITANPVLSGGTANGVLYLNGSKVATSGSALTFDGTTFSNTGSGDRAKFGTGSRNLYIAGDSTGVSLFDGAGQTGNGWYINGASNFVAGYIGSSEQMRLTSTGLGIGTSSPSYKLDVRVAPASGGAAGAGVTTGSYEGTIAITGSAYNNYGVGANTAWLYSATNDVAIGPYGGSGTVQIVTGGARRATFDSSGNLGLGVTPSAWGGLSTYRSMEFGTSVGTGILGGPNDFQAFANAYYATGWKYAGTGLASSYKQGSGVHSWYTATSGTAGNAITFSQAMTLDASGRLGVGTTTINAQMVIGGVGGYSVGGNRNTLQLRNSNSSGNQSNFFVFGSAGTESSCWIANDIAANGTEVNVLAFGTNNTERARITSGGDVGIGTSSPATKLEAVGVIRASSGTGQLNIGITGGIPYIQGYDSATAGNRQLAFYTGTEVMRLDSSGNLGLGVTPSAWGSNFKAIDVGTTAAFYAAPASVVFAAVDGNNYSTSGGAFYKTNGFATRYFQLTTGSHAWYTAASGTAGTQITFTQAMTLDASGNLLVGTTSSLGGYKFQINGDLSSSYGQTVTSTQSSGFFINFSTSSGQCGYITGTGTSSSYVTSSDYRLKENIAPMTGALAKVAALKPCTYTWKADGSAGEGFIAHELQEVAPYAVSGEKDGEQMQGVDYGKITPLLTAALQEAITQIKSLKARVAKLEAR